MPKRFSRMRTIEEIVAERSEISAAIDDEFSSMPARPATRKIYHWSLHRWVVAPLLDLGAKREQRPAPKMDGVNVRQRKVYKKQQRNSPQANKIEQWLREHGPATARQISDGAGVPYGTVNYAMRCGDFFSFKKVKISAPSGGFQWLYELEDE